MTQPSILSKLIEILAFIAHIWTSITGFYNHYYSKIAEKVLEGEQSERYRIKKSILFHHCYLTIILSIVMPFFNPEASIIKSVGNTISAVCQIFILRTKNYALIGNYSYFHAILNVVFQYFTEGEPLTIIGQILANQHMFFLFPENNFLGKIYIPLILFLVRDMLQKMIGDINSWTFDGIEYSLKSLSHSWPIIFLFHHYGAKNLTTSYRLALIKNMEIQKELTETLSLLKKTNKELKGALKSRELFIASVSHELRNPLNCLIGNIELLRLDVKNEKWLKTLDTCKICCEVLLGQINNVLDVAKINAEKLELHCLPGNFHRLIEKVWSISAIPIKQKKLRGEIRIARNFPKYLNMDSHRLTQIFLNLIGNASKFTKEGFVSITITWHTNESIEELKNPSQEYVTLTNSKRKSSSSIFTNHIRSLNFEDATSLHFTPSIELDDTVEKQCAIDTVSNRTLHPKLLSQVLTSSFVCSTVEDVAIESKTNVREPCTPCQKGMIKIDVVDSGCGIPQEALKELFQPFKQADSSITRQFGGTGLGLYITKEIIQKMGGEIFVYSTENVGADFCVLIPAETAKREDVIKEEAPANEEDPLDEMAEVRALIVDDTLDNQFILSSYLKKLGIQSDLANNGLEAVNMVRSKAPNYYTFITMDLQMPIMDGLSAMKAIRRHEHSIAAKETPIIVITANCADTEKSKCMDPKGEIRAFNFFRKPFTFDECSSVVQTLVSDKQKDKKGPKVLIVDDDAFTTTVSQEYMEKHGFQTSICSNGKEALNIVKKEEFDIVLMDCEMPEMNGYATATQMKKLSPGTLILGVTGHRREECLRKCLDSGMFDVETKPIDFKKIVNLISKIPHQKREFLR